MIYSHPSLCPQFLDVLLLDVLTVTGNSREAVSQKLKQPGGRMDKDEHWRNFEFGQVAGRVLAPPGGMSYTDAVLAGQESPLLWLDAANVTRR
jgi:hypothetical protein